jgi:tRNA-guanine transglycosylases, various specificities
LRQAGGLHKFNRLGASPADRQRRIPGLLARQKTGRLKEERAAHSEVISTDSKHLFTPENVMEIQRIIGADIMMAFDECCPGDADKRYAKRSMELTHRWLDRCH